MFFWIYMTCFTYHWRTNNHLSCFLVGPQGGSLQRQTFLVQVYVCLDANDRLGIFTLFIRCHVKFGCIDWSFKRGCVINWDLGGLDWNWLVLLSGRLLGLGIQSEYWTRCMPGTLPKSLIIIVHISRILVYFFYIYISPCSWEYRYYSTFLLDMWVWTVTVFHWGSSISSANYWHHKPLLFTFEMNIYIYDITHFKRKQLLACTLIQMCQVLHWFVHSFNYLLKKQSKHLSFRNLTFWRTL